MIGWTDEFKEEFKEKVSPDLSQKFRFFEYLISQKDRKLQKIQ